MKGIRVYGWLTLGMSGVLAVVIAFVETHKTILPSGGMAMWAIVWLGVFIGYGLLQRSNLARIGFLVWALFAAFLFGMVFLQVITLGIFDVLGVIEVMVGLCGLAYGLSGFCYFLRPSIKAQFQIRSIGREYMKRPIGLILIAAYFLLEGVYKLSKLSSLTVAQLLHDHSLDVLACIIPLLAATGLLLQRGWGQSLALFCGSILILSSGRSLMLSLVHGQTSSDLFTSVLLLIFGGVIIRYLLKPAVRQRFPNNPAWLFIVGALLIWMGGLVGHIIGFILIGFGAKERTKYWQEHRELHISLKRSFGILCILVGVYFGIWAVKVFLTPATSPGDEVRGTALVLAIVRLAIAPLVFVWLGIAILRTKPKPPNVQDHMSPSTHTSP